MNQTNLPIVTAGLWSRQVILLHLQKLTTWLSDFCIRNDSAIPQLKCTPTNFGRGRYSKCSGVPISIESTINHNLEIDPEVITSDYRTRNLVQPPDVSLTVFTGISAILSICFFPLWVLYGDAFPLKKWDQLPQQAPPVGGGQAPPVGGQAPLRQETYECCSNAQLRCCEFVLEYYPLIAFGGLFYRSVDNHCDSYSFCRHHTLLDCIHALLPHP
jgi:hypothetical protein